MNALSWAVPVLMILGSAAYLIWAIPRLVRDLREQWRANRPLPPWTPPEPAWTAGGEYLAWLEAEFEAEGSEL